MFTLLRTALSFFSFYIIMSFPINGESIFNHMYEVTSPITNPIYKTIKTASNSAYTKIKKFGTELFVNSNPTISVEKYTDSINQKFSSGDKNESDPSHGSLSDDYSNTDKQDLRKMFK